MSFRSKADRVIGQLQLKILGTEIKDDAARARQARLLRCHAHTHYGGDVFQRARA